MDDRQLERYSRQLIVPGVDLEGQEALALASVLIVGCGGLGTPVAMYLAAAGVGRIVLVDDDEVELSNLPRQIAYQESDVGFSKAFMLASRLGLMNQDIAVEFHETRFGEHNADQLLADVSMVIDATDNRATRLLIDAQTALRGIPWFMGAAVQMSGQNIAFSAHRSEGCYHCLSPESVTGSAGSCRELGILGPVVGSVALTQAMDAIKCITGCAEVPWGILRLHDFRKDESHRLVLGKQAHCPLCGSN